MPGMDGMTLIREARAIAPDLPVVIITAVPSQTSAIDAVNLGVRGYLTKPFRMPQILSVVAKATGR
jgi:DNA-binding response OmpR family regulator